MAADWSIACGRGVSSDGLECAFDQSASRTRNYHINILSCLSELIWAHACWLFRYCFEINHAIASNTWNQGSNELHGRFLASNLNDQVIKTDCWLDWPLLSDYTWEIGHRCWGGQLRVFYTPFSQAPWGLHRGPPLRRLSRNRSLTEGGSVSIVLLLYRVPLPAPTQNTKWDVSQLPLVRQRSV